METKISASIRTLSSYGGGRSLGRTYAAKVSNSKSADAYIGTQARGGEGYYLSHRAQLDSFTRSIRDAVQLDRPNIAKDDHAGRTKFNFEWISKCENGLNENIPKKLEDAGVPKDTAFEFDFDFNSTDIKVTGISDEKYRDSIEEILDSCKGTFVFMSCASRVMNGYISSLYHPWISGALDRCFGQDIKDLYIDENGNLGGANKKLQSALDAVKRAEKNGEYLNVKDEFGFPAENIEGIVKRMAADKNITPNISRMGYDGERIYTNDGEFRFGRDFDPNLFGEEKYVMRGTMAFYMTFYGRYNSWLENEEKFC
ncbi:MAG: hypothetical protein NC120_13715 [Ruminococcus sp.]|nr:hypothetical protein [Ruminococcus sp.]